MLATSLLATGKLVDRPVSVTNVSDNLVSDTCLKFVSRNPFKHNSGAGPTATPASRTRFLDEVMDRGEWVMI